MKKLKQNKGITLIALVITILVLLILAGVTLNTLLGEGGIIQRAQDAKVVQDKAEVEEQIKLAWTSVQTQGLAYNWTTEQKRAALQAELRLQDSNATVTADGNILTVTYRGYQTTINALTGAMTALTKVDTNLGTKNITDATELAALEANGMKELTGNEITNSNLKNNPNIRAVLTGQIPIPAGYTYVEGTSTSESTKPEGGSWGVVVKDTSDNEWVWVPVNATESIAPSDMYETISETSIVSATLLTNKMNLAQKLDGIKIASLNGLSVLRLAESDSESSTGAVTKTVTKRSKTILTGIDRGSPDDTSSYREPALISYDSQNYIQAGFTSAQDMADKMVIDYNDMIASIEKYGGFYVGRYELSGTSNGFDGEIEGPTVQSGQPPIDTVSWYRQYKANRSFAKSSTISTMIWGCQWDVVCLWAGKVGDLTTYRYYGTLNDDEYNMLTGSRPGDKLNNVYDLQGCRLELTQEATYGNDRATRGGHYYTSDPGAMTRSAIAAVGFTPTDSYDVMGSRPTLYIK